MRISLKLPERLHISFTFTIERIYTGEVRHMSSHYWLIVNHDSRVVGVERIVGFIGVEFVVVDVGVLTKSVYSSNTRSLQLCHV